MESVQSALDGRERVDSPVTTERLNVRDGEASPWAISLASLT